MLKKIGQIRILLIAIGAIGMSGCAAEPAVVAQTPTAVATATPAFATETEALIAARSAFAQYLAASDQVWQLGGYLPETMAETVTARWLEEEVAEAQALQSAGKFQVGSGTFHNIALMKMEFYANGSAGVEISLCLDISDTFLVDVETGSNPFMPEPPRLPYQAILLSESTNPTHLVVGETSLHIDEDYCDE